MTDDRGVYRVFGLPPGRYRVSRRRRRPNRAPSARPAQALPAHLLPGRDRTGAGARRRGQVGVEAPTSTSRSAAPLKTYKVSGRFVTPTPTSRSPDSPSATARSTRAGGRTGGYRGGTTTNARGEFETDGLAPGRYKVYSANSPGRERNRWSCTATPSSSR